MELYHIFVDRQKYAPVLAMSHNKGQPVNKE
jgi:hypothetical protein